MIAKAVVRIIMFFCRHEWQSRIVGPLETYGMTGVSPYVTRHMCVKCGKRSGLRAWN